MSNIKRYDFLIMANNDTRMAQTNIGDYVLFSDHEQRVKELERWFKLESGKLWLENDDLQAKLDRAISYLQNLEMGWFAVGVSQKSESVIEIKALLAELKGEL